MSKTINILVAVNVTGATNEAGDSNGNVGDYVYMMDDSDTIYPHGTSGGDGTHELVTFCESGDKIRWHAYSIDPSQTVAITGVTGQIISQLDFHPSQEPGYNGAVWSGTVNGAGTKVQYSLSLQLNGKTNGWFDPFVTSTYPQAAKR
ncbi:hypothetical protein ACV229_08030 [Burkholderia sp. MR1-5-21]